MYAETPVRPGSLDFSFSCIYPGNGETDYETQTTPNEPDQEALQDPKELPPMRGMNGPMKKVKGDAIISAMLAIVLIALGLGVLSR